MRDFRQLVGPENAKTNFEPEIVKELAAHLEETYLELCASGASEEDAYQRVAEIGSGLGPTLRRLQWLHQGGAIAILRSVVLPGVIGYVLHQAARTGLFVLKAEEWIFPLCIALGLLVSSISRELGGSEGRRRAAALFPAGVYLAGWCVMGLLVTPYQVLHGWPAGAPINWRGVVVSLLWVLLSDVLFPAAGLAMGAAIGSRYFPATGKSLRKQTA